MQIVHCGQLTDEWFDAHIGRCSGSHASDMLDFTLKGDEGSKRRDYRALKVAETLTGLIASNRTPTFEMQWGIEHEDEARLAYSMEESVLVERVGYVLADDERMLCSPDGFIGSKGILEVKCPKTANHLKWMLDAKIPDEHLPQCRFALMVCKDRQWVDFVSFDPRLPKRYQMFIIRLMREDAKVPEMYAAADLFMQDVQKTIEALEGIAPPITPEPLPKALDGMLTESDFAGLL